MGLKYAPADAKENGGPMDAMLRRLAGPFVYAVALHSLGVGLAMTVAPQWTLGFGGFGGGGAVPSFFVRQGGVFHLVLAVVYILEWRRRRRLGAMLVAKGLATVFLAASVLSGEGAAWAVGASLVGDFAMAVLAFLFARAIARFGG